VKTAQMPLKAAKADDSGGEGSKFLQTLLHLEEILEGNRLRIALQSCSENGSSSWTRTSDHSINSRTLYQLSYRGIGAPFSKLGGVCKPNYRVRC
jgi:hypothetical protein